MARVKLFTIDEAEKALPLVRRIVGDIVRVFRECEKCLIEREQLPARPTAGSATEERALALEREKEAHEQELQRFIDELSAIGVELKDVRIGLIDFFSHYDGRVVYLCWKIDEGDTLAWWHELHGGFRGRQPITPANRARFLGLKAGEKFVEI